MSRADERRMVFSRRRERRVSGVVGLPWYHIRAVWDTIMCGVRLLDAPTSNAGDAIGENSVLMLKTPSNLRSANGAVTSAEIRTSTLES